MNQTMIYDYLGLDTDPLLQKLKTLSKGQKLDLGDYSVMLNSAGIYEVSSDETHDGFKSVKECYKRLLMVI